ncbi:uncharacterized protein MONBRDRAFT_24392 [Monosiga brevicollis MX1]|uniref:Carbohydrate kinase FGGY N-terminal domain-containing protein n=1 Tax=Monosiga brevicollis TaxID=81824 RepID=A9UWA0_MONBE|nr:uncharacterized protein MONBRDRAFT_24392 [Monosiga brevicollis MX1]EDQ90728.1 predicted protein [Monosiga brevicollis MX1]|eukprot:XP_001744779.1 hypothetical protein [Monosiga brevicollis MX1]
MTKPGAAPVVLGVDIGTTAIKLVALDSQTRALLHDSDRPHHASQGQARQDCTWREDANCLYVTTTELLAELPADVRARITHMALTGQMHGAMASHWTNGTCDRATACLTWQDKRWSEDEMDRLTALAKQFGVSPIHHGYGLSSLLWLQNKGDLTAEPGWHLHSALEYVAARLSHSSPESMAPSIAFSLGGAVMPGGTEFDPNFAQALGLEPSLIAALPQIVPPGCLWPSPVHDTEAERLGLPKGITVSVPEGDNQMQVFAIAQAAEIAPSAYRHTAMLNLGTSCQLTQIVADAELATLQPLSPMVEIRPYTANHHLLTVASLNGGNLLHRWASTLARTPEEESATFARWETQAFCGSKPFSLDYRMFGERGQKDVTFRLEGVPAHVDEVAHQLMFELLSAIKHQAVGSGLVSEHIERLVLTGGASAFPFVRDVCKLLFPAAQVEVLSHGHGPAMGAALRNILAEPNASE